MLRSCFASLTRQTRHLLRGNLRQLSKSDQSGNDDKLVPKKKEHELQNIPKESRRLPGMHDFKNPWEVLKYEYKFDAEDMVPRHTDILIIGGGVIGWSVAYWIREAAKINVTVIERDPSHSRSTTVLSVGGIRQQFSEPENIQMSMFGAEFLRNIREHLSVLDQDPPDIQFSPQGYLCLASENGVEQMNTNFALQKSLGAKVEMLSKDKIKERWPWINVSDVEAGVYGFENEGWFDPYLLLQAMRRKAASLGVQYIVGELTGFEYDADVTPTSAINQNTGNLRTALIRTTDGNINPIEFSKVVNAAGPWAGEVARMAEIGVEGGLAGALPLPVKPRRQNWFVVAPRNGNNSQQNHIPSIDTPWIIDSSGVQLRRQDLGNDFIVFKDPPPISDKDEPNVDDLEVDYTWFDEVIWPQLAHRVPAMEAVKVRSAWAGFYDYNYVDQNLIIGNHPVHRNMVFCNGSSGHGIQHAVAIGRAIKELLYFDDYKTIDLSRFSFSRFIMDQPVYEKCIY